MAKFIIGVLVGLVLGASTTAYGAGASQTGTSSGWTAGEEVCSGPNTTEASGHSNGSHSWRANLSR